MAENRPAQAVDSCFNTDGALMHAGEDVWNGILDSNAEGTCTSEFPILFHLPQGVCDYTQPDQGRR